MRYEHYMTIACKRTESISQHHLTLHWSRSQKLPSAYLWARIHETLDPDMNNTRITRTWGRQWGPLLFSQSAIVRLRSGGRRVVVWLRDQNSDNRGAETRPTATRRLGIQPEKNQQKLLSLSGSTRQTKASTGVIGRGNQGNQSTHRKNIDSWRKCGISCKLQL